MPHPCRRRRRRARASLFVSMGVVAAAAAAVSPATLAAAPFTFTKIADSAGAFSRFEAPAINDHGAVVFAAQLDGSSYYAPYDGPDPSANLVMAPGFSDRRAGINNSGTIVYRGYSVAPAEGIFTVAPNVTRVDGKGAYADFIGPAINNAGDIAFFAHLDVRMGVEPYGIFRGPDPATDVVGAGYGPYTTFYNPDINDAGTVVFSALLTDGSGTGVFRGPNPATDTVVDTSGPFAAINGHVSINNAGTVAFRADLDAGGSGIFIGPDPDWHTIATSAGAYDVFGDADINLAGTVAFRATLDGGGEGIFVGPDSIAHRVIATGDSLFDSTVASVAFFKGLNERGDIAFAYRLDSGERGIAVAHVPEPGALAGVFLAAGVLVRRRRRR